MFAKLLGWKYTYGIVIRVFIEMEAILLWLLN